MMAFIVATDAPTADFFKEKGFTLIKTQGSEKTFLFDKKLFKYDRVDLNYYLTDMIVI